VRGEVRLKSRESSVRLLRADRLRIGEGALRSPAARRARPSCRSRRSSASRFWWGVVRCLPSRVHTSAAREEAVEPLMLPIRYEMLMALS